LYLTITGLILSPPLLSSPTTFSVEVVPYHYGIDTLAAKTDEHSTTKLVVPYHYGIDTTEYFGFVLFTYVVPYHYGVGLI